MRIVIVRRESGIALSMDVYTNNLVAELRKLRPTWEIIEISPDSWSSSGKENLWNSGTGFRKYYERLWNHPRQVCQVQGDLYHIIDHSNAHVAYWLKKLKKPIIVTCHDLVQFIYPEILKGQSRFPAFSLASWEYSVKGMKYANCVVAVSENTATDVYQMLGIEAQRVVVVPNGVESSFHPLSLEKAESFRQQHQRSPDEICLLNVGSTHQRKNIPTILSVLKILKDRGVPVRLWRTGGAFMADQEAFIKENKLHQDILNFSTPDKDSLIQLYNAADVLLAPSLYEGFGLTILEAMACGLPIITSNVSSIPEVVGDGAIMIPPMDSQAISEAVVHLKQNDIYRQELIERGLARAKKFTWEKSAEHLVHVYEWLMGKQSQKLSITNDC
jgi:glycosyltransferase involved in cell wall biosynthesis